MSVFPAKLQPWPTAIVAVLVTQICFGIWMARVAGNDPNFAIEPDYYARAVNWDATMAQSRLDKALGWQATVGMTRAAGRTATLRLKLTDSTGTPIVTADSVLVEALAVAHAGQIDRLRLVRDGDGYIAPVSAANAGLWEVRVRAMRGTDVFTAKLRTELP
jgi:nitrogen fixation protein FixH